MKQNVILFCLVLSTAIFACKSQNHVSGLTASHKLQYTMHSDTMATDTIVTAVHDTTIVELPAEFSRGLIWKQVGTNDHLTLLKQDEKQRYIKQTRKDFQRFHYLARDTGRYMLTYHLVTGFGKDTTLYDSKNTYFIIKNTSK